MKKILIPILLLAVLAVSRTAVPNQRPGGRAFQNARHDINNITLVISNFGTFGQDETGNNGGCWWRYSGYTVAWCYIYGAGPWFGTIKGVDTLVTIGYGPSGGQFEYAPGLAGWSVSDPDAIIYRYPTTWPPSDRYAMAPTAYKSHQDSWCAINDLDITYHMPGDTRPIGLEIYQTGYAWNLTTTADIVFMKFECKNVTDQMPEHQPDGVTLSDCYFGVIADNDIGNEAGTAANDICSAVVRRTYIFPTGDTIFVDNLGYQWQEEPEGGWPIFPGAIGFDYLQSPFNIPDAPGLADADSDGIDDFYEMDSAWFALYHPPPDPLWDADQDGTPDWMDPSQIPQMGLTCFKRFTLDLEPSRDNDRYTTMAGYNFVTGVYEPYDTIPPDPDDQRFGQCSGPFDLEPGESVTVLVGIMIAAWSDAAPGAPPGSRIYGTPDSSLAWVDQTAQFIYDQNWLLPGPPPPPNLTLLPGDNQVTLVWDTHAETAPDPYFDVVGDPTSVLYDPFYKQYDFQGVGVWKSMDGITYELLARYDLADTVAFEDPEQGISATNTGMVHSYIDRDVRNGFAYYYAVSAFDYNHVRMVEGTDTFPSPIWFESGRVGVTAEPRRDPANFVPAGTPVIDVERGNPLLSELVSVNPIYPLEIDTLRPLYLEFLAPDTATISVGGVSILGANYAVQLKNVDGEFVAEASAIRRLGIGFAVYEFTPEDGFAVTPSFGTEEWPASIQAFEAAEVQGTYPIDRILVNIMSPLPNPTSHYTYGFWAYRGNDYKVQWAKTDPAGPVNTIIVTDLMFGDTIPFQPFNNTDTTRHLGECWCFVGSQLTVPWGLGSSDTIKIAGPGPGQSKFLYLNGGMIGLNNGAAMLDTLRPSDGEVWILRANTNYLPPSAYGSLKISATPGYYASEMVEPLNVKVCPNPYIIFNEWQTTFLDRRLKFINLPAECTVRIFNLNGELVRTIFHTATSEGGVEGDLGGDEWWDLLSDNRQLVSSGTYIFHVQSEVGEQIGKFVVIR